MGAAQAPLRRLTSPAGSSRAARLLLAALLALYALPFTSALFYELIAGGVLAASVAGAALAIAGAIVFTRAIAPAALPRIRAGDVALFTLLLVLALVLLRPDRFGGFPGLGGGDGGLAVDRARGVLIDGTPVPGYQGQTALFIVAAWARTLGMDYPYALALPLWSALLIGPALVVTASARATARRGSLVLASLGSAAALPLVVLPILLYTYADGFWPQVFGLVPAGATIVAQAFIRSPLARILCVGFGVFSVRYAYALNLGDLAVMVTLLSAAEVLKRGLDFRVRALAGLLACASLVVAVLTYGRVADLLPITGGFRPYPPVPWVVGLVVMACGLALVSAIARGTPLGRLSFGAGVFALCAAVFMASVLAGDRPLEYYFFKYGLAPAALGALVSAVVLAWLVREAVEPTLRRRLLAAAASACLVGGLALLAVGTWDYRQILWENAGLREPALLARLFDPRAAQEIRAVMAEHPGATVAGLVSPYWPETSITSAVSWRPKSGRGGDAGAAQSNIQSGAITTEDSDPAQPRCLFWYDTAVRGAEYQVGTRGVLEGLHAIATCQVGEPHICHACLRERRLRSIVTEWGALAGHAKWPPIERDVGHRAGELCLARVDQPLLAAGVRLGWNGQTLSPLHPQARDFFHLRGGSRRAREEQTLRLEGDGVGPLERASEVGLTLHCFSAASARARPVAPAALLERFRAFGGPRSPENAPPR